MKRIILLLVLIVVAVGAWYIYNEYNRTNADLTNKKADVTVDALALIAAFEKDTASASKQYIDKIVAVSGAIKKIESEDNPVVLFLGDAGQMSSVQCSMDSSHAKEYASVKEGTQVTIKGNCNGYQYDELLGTDVKLNRCVIHSNQ